MKNSKLGLKALGLATLGALSMTAIFAAGAQAQGTLGEFQVDLSSALAVGKTIAGAQEGLWGKLEVEKRGINIKCKTGAASGEITGAKHGLLSVTFGGCLVFSYTTDTQLVVCAVHSAGHADGTILAAALLLPVLHGGNNYVLAEHKKLGDGTLHPFTTIEILGASCAVRGTYAIFGSVVAQVLNSDTTQPLLDLSQAIQKLVGDVLSFGPFEAFINASFTVELTGTHAGKKLGVV